MRRCEDLSRGLGGGLQLTSFDCGSSADAAVDLIATHDGVENL